MDKNWFDELHEKYKHLFEVYEGEETERSYYKKGQILRGIECGSGWEKPVQKYLETLEWLRHNRTTIDNPSFDEECDEVRSDDPLLDNRRYIQIPVENNVVQIFQIKEKFGSVRAYASCPDHMKSDVSHALGALERECHLRCESCGKLHENGVQSTDSGWLRCACDECWEKSASKRRIK